MRLNTYKNDIIYSPYECKYNSLIHNVRSLRMRQAKNLTDKNK